MFKLLTLLSIFGFVNTNYAINADYAINTDYVINFNISLQLNFKYLNEFSSFIETYNKSYVSNSYLLSRYLIFVENMDYINARNNENLSYTLAMNQYGDLTFDEFSILYKGYNGLINRSNSSYPEHHMTFNTLSVIKN